MLYHYEPAKDPLTSWWTPFKKLFSSEANQLIIDSDEFRLAAFIDDRDREKRLISNVYHGLNLSLQDSNSVSHAIVSFSGWKNFEYTYLFKTNLVKNASTSANSTGKFIRWNTTSGNFSKSYDLNPEQSSGYNLFITAAFTVYLNGTQHLFFIMNNKVSLLIVCFQNV